MKKMINKIEDIVDEMLDGYIAAFPEYVKRSENNSRVVLRTTPKQSGHVALVIGNGSGHEPIAVGWIGKGLLDANAVGDIFTAPSPDMIADAIRFADTGAGVLLLISSHSGDIMNGEVAVELAQTEGINVESLIMYDDISSAPRDNLSQRRGAPGTTFIYKILGAYAEQGASLSELKVLGETVRDNTCTLGASLQSGISPLTKKPMFTLPKNSLYIGMGVHGEPGLAELKMAPADEIVSYMMGQILGDLPFSSNDRVFVMVNGTGGLTLMEQLIIYRQVHRILHDHGITALPPLIGSYVTTQESVGFSISLCRATQQMIDLWAEPYDAPFFYK